MARTGAKKEKVQATTDVLRKHLHGAALADGKVNRMRKSSGGGKNGKAKVKIKYPPEGGWKGGA